MQDCGSLQCGPIRTNVVVGMIFGACATLEGYSRWKELYQNSRLNRLGGWRDRIITITRAIPYSTKAATRPVVPENNQEGKPEESWDSI